MEVSEKRGSNLFYDPYPGDPQEGNSKVSSGCRGFSVTRMRVSEAWVVEGFR